MEERILIVGGGIAGLWSALALAKSGRSVTVIERDPPAPEGEDSADLAFTDWERRGVGHLRHSHAFLARLHKHIREWHPELMQDLLAAGCREIGFVDNLPLALRETYVPAPGDEELTILTSRRTTLEFVMRRYALRQPGIEFVTDTLVRDVLTETRSGRLAVTGLVIERDGERQEWSADAVIDAAGKNSQLVDTLNERGAGIEEKTERAGILYFTRHYRLHEGMGEPERNKVPSAGDMGFMKYGVFPADNGCFSITIAVPEIEMELRKAIIRPETFDFICSQLPGVAPWTAEDRSTPVSKVYGMGELISRWRKLADDDGPRVLNFFPLGDSLIRTNPLYGRGCTFAAIEAETLVHAFDRTENPVARGTLYFNNVRDALRPYYSDMVKQDKAAIRRARNALDPDYRPNLRNRVIRSFAEDAITPALRGDTALLREFMRAFHMIDKPSEFLRNPGNIAKIMGVWARGKKRNARHYPPKLGPDRQEMMALLDLPATSDWERLRDAA